MNNKIIIQLRDGETNHISASFQFTFMSEQAAMQSLQGTLVRLNIHGVMDVENVEVDMNLNGVKLQKSNNFFNKK